jgi:hypothetical protein
MRSRGDLANLFRRYVPDLEADEMSTVAQEPTTQTEYIKVSGARLVDRAKQLIHEGNVRRITVTHSGDVVLSIPVTVGVIGSLMAPWLAAIGGVAALLSDCTLEVERRANDDPSADVRGDEEPAGSAES